MGEGAGSGAECNLHARCDGLREAAFGNFRNTMAMVFLLAAVSVAGGIYVILLLLSVCLSPKAMR